MAVPSLPSAKNTNDIVDNAWVDAVRSNLDWWLNSRPVFSGRASALNALGTATVLTTSTFTTIGFGDGGSFIFTPDVNIGGWTVQGSDATPESLVVPEDGVYRITLYLEYDNTDVDGDRYVALLLDGSVVSGSVVFLPAAAQNTSISHTFLIELADGDQLDIRGWQNSGSDVEILLARLDAVWEINP